MHPHTSSLDPSVGGPAAPNRPPRKDRRIEPADCLSWGLLTLCLLTGGGAFGGPVKPPSLQVLPPQESQSAEIQLRDASASTWAVFFFRLEGEEGFQALTLRLKEGIFSGTLPSLEGGGRLEYFVAFKGTGEAALLPAGAPETLGKLDLPASQPTVPRPPATHAFPFQVDGSLEEVLSRSNPYPGERTRFAAGQVRLGYRVEQGDQNFSLDARMSYQDTVPPGASRWSLAELRSRYGRGAHALQAGDMMVQESEFSIGGAGRRGFDYTYQGPALYAHAFAVNTQRLQGFQGMVWPGEGTRVFGGALGYGWFEGRLRSKLVLLTGRDDPSQAMGLGFLPFNRIREGTTLAWTVEASLPAQGLNFNGEWARSRFDADVAQDPKPLTDDAWRLGGTWMAKGFYLRSSYKAVGRDFGSVGLPVLPVDRHAFDGGAGFSRGAWSLNFNAQNERNNPEGNPLETRSTNAARSLDLRYSLSPNASVRLGGSQTEQETHGAVNAFIPFASSRRHGGFAGLDWSFAPLGMFSLNAQVDRLRSLGPTETAGRSETLTMALALVWPDRLRLSPNVSLARTLDEVTGQQTRNASVFLSSTVTFVPGLFSLALNGGHNRLELTNGTILESSSADGALQVQFDRFLGQAFGRGACMLALRGKYLRRQDLPTSDRRISLTLNFAF